jgi:hypothetical protein
VLSNPDDWEKIKHILNDPQDKRMWMKKDPNEHYKRGISIISKDRDDSWTDQIEFSCKDEESYLKKPLVI